MLYYHSGIGLYILVTQFQSPLPRLQPSNTALPQHSIVRPARSTCSYAYSASENKFTGRTMIALFSTWIGRGLETHESIRPCFLAATSYKSRY